MLLLAVVVLLSAHPGRVRPVPAREVVARESCPAVVLIGTRDATGQPIAFGSGFFVAPLSFP